MSSRGRASRRTLSLHGTPSSQSGPHLHSSKMAATRPEFKSFPHNRRLSVREQIEHDEYSRQMYEFMKNKAEDDKLNALREQVRAEEKKLRAMRKQKRAMKRAARAASTDSGYWSAASSRSQAPIGQNQGSPYPGANSPIQLVPNPFYMGPTLQPPVQLVANPFYDPSYAVKASN